MVAKASRNRQALETRLPLDDLSEGAATFRVAEHLRSGEMTTTEMVISRSAWEAMGSPSSINIRATQLFSLDEVYMPAEDNVA